MPTRTADRLRQVRSFPQLVKYLRDELDWPIEQANFEDLAFDWDPQELGIDAKNAAKIEEIKQLRPLENGQPWGIFFVKFEPKQLPIVALRRILGQLAVKKRASARKADQRTWRADDLLFISAYGEGGDRQLSFAHFAAPANERDIPTLRVLGWDGDDTTLKLDHVARTLDEKLSWPREPDEVDEWRARWASAFVLRPREVIRTSKELAVRLADLAKGIRLRAEQLLELESDRGPLRRLHEAFRTALIHDLTESDFADTYAQTIAYGLFSAAVTGEGMGERRVLVADDVATGVPMTNPFLRELLGSFLTAGGRKGKIDVDELGVQEVVELLRSPDTHLTDILRDFGNRTRDEDPVIHFYESFLKEYDKRRKVERGVFYTPQPVVSYIVRSVHELLQSEFGLEDGLASTVTWKGMAARHPGLTIPNGTDPESHFVTILDPAAGTATFLVEVIEVVYRTMTERWKQEGASERARAERWNSYVPAQLLPRLFGYELMMAPYAIAHMKVGLKLLETGYRFSSDERARIYLTNTLEPPQDSTDRFEFAVPALAHEAAAVNRIKARQRFTVVIGNPPYSGHSLNNQVDWIVDKVYDYKRGLPDLQKPGQAKWLQDDYVKFIRYAEYLLEQVSAGVLGFVTNHSFLDNATFRGMRRHLLGALPRLSLTDLHGNSKKKERSPDGSSDENVFDIQQGVAVLLARRVPLPARVMYAELFGPRGAKYERLRKHSNPSLVDAVELKPSEPAFLLRPHNQSLADEYQRGIALDRLMGINGDPAPGIVTTQDELAISWTAAEATEKVDRLLGTRTEAEARELFTLCSQSQWNYQRAKRALSDGSWREQVVPVLYRPFDWRWTVFNSHVAVHRRERVMRHLLDRNNIALICTRQTKDEWGVYVTRDICTHKTCGAYDINYVFPLYLSNEGGFDIGEQRSVNLSPQLLRPIASVVRPDADDQGHITGRFEENVFSYAYAVFHSKDFRRRYCDFLRAGFPRLPIPCSRPLFEALAQQGDELISLHLLESEKLDRQQPEYVGSRRPQVEKPTWSSNTIWLDKERKAGFRSVREDVWKFHIGGYQVCEKWLKDRNGRTLSAAEIRHYQRIVVALRETTRIMTRIDEVIAEHGGWPSAFQPLAAPMGERDFPAAIGLMHAAEGRAAYRVDSEEE